MTRKKAVSLVLVVVLALAVLVAPMVAATSGAALQMGQTGINLVTVGVSHTSPAGIACEGCTGGGGGPG